MLDVMQTMFRDVSLSRADDALLLSETDRIFRRVGVLTSFHLHKYENVAFPPDHVDLAAPRAKSRTDDAITKRAEVVDGTNLSTAAKRQKTVEKQRKRHEYLR